MSHSMVSPSYTDSLIVPTTTSIFYELTVDTDRRVPKVPGGNFDANIVGYYTTHGPPEPSMVRVVPEREVASNTDSDTGEGPSLTPTPPTPQGRIITPFTPNDYPGSPFEARGSGAHRRLSIPRGAPRGGVVIEGGTECPLVPAFSITDSPTATSPYYIVAVPVIFLYLYIT